MRIAHRHRLGGWPGLVHAFAIAAGCCAAARGDETAARDAAWIDSLRRAREALEWTDEIVRHEWRLQRRPGADDHRLLDPRDRVVRAGTADECRRALEALERDGTVPPVRGHAVLLLHGLGEGRESMRPLADHLRAVLDATVLTVGYASVKADIDDHGRALAGIVAALPHVDRVSFVGHSLGNLVVRRWAALAAASDLDRTHRMVMLGPPNQGSELAGMAGKVWWLAAHAEGAARDLVCDWPRVAPGLAVPPFPFGIVAGGRGDDVGFSPLLSGDDDAVVRVAETRLEGAGDFMLLPVHHAAMMRDPAVQRATERFLSTGRFAGVDDDTTARAPE